MCHSAVRTGRSCILSPSAVWYVHNGMMDVSQCCEVRSVLHLIPFSAVWCVHNGTMVGFSLNKAWWVVDLRYDSSHCLQPLPFAIPSDALPSLSRLTLT